MNISSKVALVTGAAEGLGKAFAEALLKKAAKGVSLVDINVERGQATEREFQQKYGSERAVFMQCDVSSSKQLKDVFQKTKEHYGQLDIVVNNAGIMDEVDWVKSININLKATIEGTYLAEQHMSKLNGGNGGVVINIASYAGLIPAPYSPVYSATKHGVVAFDRSITRYHKSFTPDNIRLNTLCPAFINTPIVQKGRIDADDQTAKQLRSRYIFMPIEDVAAGVISLIEGAHHGQVLKMTHTGTKLVTFPKL